MNSIRRIVLYLTVATAFGLFSFARRYFDAMASERSPSPWPILLDEISAVWLAGLLILAVVSTARRYSLDRYWWAYLAAAPIYAVVHTLAMYATRSLLYPLFGMGRYHYGGLGYRFLMEAPLQLLGYGLTLIAIVVYARTRRARDAERLEGLLAEAQLERLRLSIAPHFLFNTLNVISAAVYESPAKADELIGRLSRLLRALLAADHHQTCPLGRELELLDEYLVLQKARFEDDLTLDVDCPATLHAAPVPFMILQPIVENALQHGADDEGRVVLRVSARHRDNQLILDVADCGPGPTGEAEGIGIRNTRERIDMLYGGRYGFELLPRPGGGALARLRLPWQNAS